MAHCLVIGASRGIGAEFARQYAADGYRVTGTVRRPDDSAALAALGIQVVVADVLDENWTAGLAPALGGAAIDLVIVSAGISGPQSALPETPAPADFDAVMRTNVYVTMQLVPLLADRLAAGGGKFVVLSSRMGSIGGATEASWWLYRASKAALNSVLKSTSIILGARGVVCMALHPGWVQTRMGGPAAQLPVADSVASMRRVIAAVNRSHNGRFLNYNGEQIEW